MIAGANRMRRPEKLDLWIKQLGLEHAVRRLGWVEETALAPLYRGAELGIYVSRHEGYGLPPLECLACGTPVVVSAGLGLDDAWPDYPFRIPDLDAESIAGVMTEILGNEDRTARVMEETGSVLAGARLGAELASTGGRARAGCVAMISVIIVNHDGEAHLGRCLGKSRRVGGRGAVGRQRIPRRFPWRWSGSDSQRWKCFRRRRTSGLPLPTTWPLAKASGEALLLLNADAWLEAGALDLLVAELDDRPDVGLVAPRLRYPDGRRQFSWSPARGVVGEVLQKARNPFESQAWAHGSLARWLARLVGPHLVYGRLRAGPGRGISSGWGL